ncbi:MAG: fibronectin type III domain-containing protein, partial [Acidimicrobiales bacterium]
TWTDPASNGGSAMTGYDMFCALGVPSTSGTPSGTVSGAAATSGTVTGLTNGTPYTCVVTAVNANGASVASNSLTATPGNASKVTLSLVAPTIPGGPMGVTATVSNAAGNPALPTPTGTVRFTITGVTCAEGSNTLTLVSGAATCTFTATGAVSVKAAYSGDSVFLVSSATAVTGQPSLAAPVSIWLSNLGEWTLDVQLFGAGQGVKGDLITFTSGATTLCKATTDASGVATCQFAPTAAIKAGATFVATFAGNTQLMPVTSASGTLVNP